MGCFRRLDSIRMRMRSDNTKASDPSDRFSGVGEEHGALAFSFTDFADSTEPGGAGRRCTGHEVLGSTGTVGTEPPPECMEPRMFDSTTSDEFDAVNGVATLAEARAKAMFDRVLVSWASDLLHLRRQGLNEPGWREQVEGQDGPEWRRAA